MNESGKNNPIGKKSYEIAYALWRIAANASEKSFADILCNKAIELVGFAAEGNNAKLSATGETLEAVIKFAVDVNCISISNAAILVREIGNLKSAINAATKNGFTDISIEDIFSIPEELIPEQEPEIIIDKEFGNFADMESGNEIGNQEIGGEPGKKAEIRQAAIIERIRQIGNCRLSDIQAILPDTSERTLRYDIESLVQRNIIERIGTGGRSIYYRIRQIVGEA